MRLIHYAKRETSGLFFTTLELIEEEERQGHTVCLREPNGNVLYGVDDDNWDVEVIHSQVPISNYHNGRPRFLICHGEPISSVGNGISMKAIVDLAPLCDAFICMRQEELAYWEPLNRTYCVPKGIDLNRFKPLPLSEQEQKLSGSPSVLYMEHWRGQRNPLPLVVAMLKVWREYPDARLHLYNCTNKKMLDTFQSLVKHAKLWTVVRSLQGPVKPKEVNSLLNRVDIVVSCLDPFYARSIEALGAGKAFLCPGYTDPEYPFHCHLDPDDMARAIKDVWENGVGHYNFRRWAEQKHDVRETVRQMIAIYERYLGNAAKEHIHVRREDCTVNQADRRVVQNDNGREELPSSGAEGAKRIAVPAER